MTEQNPDIAIVIAGGNVVAIATAGQGMTVRVIDLDLMKVGEPDEVVVKDYEPDVMNTDLEQYTKEVQKK